MKSLPVMVCQRCGVVVSIPARRLDDEGSVKQEIGAYVAPCAMRGCWGSMHFVGYLAITEETTTEARRT